MNVENLKVLQLGKFYPIRGGVEKVAFDLMKGLSERGIECHMLCAAEEGEDRIILLNEHAQLICTHTWVKACATMISPSMIFTLRKICGKYDIIHVHHPDPMACLALFLSGYKGKVVLHWHSDIQKQKLLLKLYYPLQQWLLKRADVIVGTSPVYLAESPFLQHVQHKTVCLPIGVEPMRPVPEAVKALRSEYPGKKIVFSLGRLVAYKGYRFLVEAAQYLKDDFVVLIGGSGALKEELQKEIVSCDVFCMSSVQKTEAFGIVQIEAMSCGKPVVATRIPQSGVSWVNEEGVSGMNAEPGNAQDLARAIEAVTENEEVYRKFSEGATKRYRDMFTKECMIDKCLTIYLEL